MQILLERAGHRVTIVRNGLEAVRAMEAARYDLVLMDIQMPVMDGLEAMRRIRAMPPPCGSTPVVAVTANAMSSDAAECYAAGATGYVTKPVTMASLGEAMARSLATLGGRRTELA